MLLLVCVLMLVSAPAAHAQDLDGPNPLEGIKLYNDPEAPAMSSWRHLQRQGRTRQADLIWKIAREPRAVWVGRFTRPASTSRSGASSTAPRPRARCR